MGNMVGRSGGSRYCLLPGTTGGTDFSGQQLSAILAARATGLREMAIAGEAADPK